MPRIRYRPETVSYAVLALALLLAAGFSGHLQHAAAHGQWVEHEHGWPALPRHDPPVVDHDHGTLPALGCSLAQNDVPAGPPLAVRTVLPAEPSSCVRTELAGDPIAPPGRFQLSRAPPRLA
ncbi:MAG: hypothetical protein HY814_04015 [Candidatus Riflebacteria bacterium]|nr:hypothetical protein [Candidatus Riflebacteria bacterium]